MRGGDAGAGSDGADAAFGGDELWHGSCGARSPALDRLQQLNQELKYYNGTYINIKFKICK